MSVNPGASCNCATDTAGRKLHAVNCAWAAVNFAPRPWGTPALPEGAPDGLVSDEEAKAVRDIVQRQDALNDPYAWNRALEWFLKARAVRLKAPNDLCGVCLHERRYHESPPRAVPQVGCSVRVDSAWTVTNDRGCGCSRLATDLDFGNPIPTSQRGAAPSSPETER